MAFVLSTRRDSLPGRSVLGDHMRALGLGPAAAGRIDSIYGTVQIFAGVYAGRVGDTHGGGRGMVQARPLGLKAPPGLKSLNLTKIKNSLSKLNLPGLLVLACATIARPPLLIHRHMRGRLCSLRDTRAGCGRAWRIMPFELLYSHESKPLVLLSLRVTLLA